MKTTRDYKWKYRGQNPLERLHEGEPYFFLRGQDSLTPKAMQFYAELLNEESTKAAGRNEMALANNLMKQALAVLRMAGEIVDWQSDHMELVKQPRIR